MRDKIVRNLCNFLMRFASENYRSTVRGLIQYGELSAYRDMKDGLEPPIHLADEYYSKLHSRKRYDMM